MTGNASDNHDILSFQQIYDITDIREIPSLEKLNEEQSIKNSEKSFDRISISMGINKGEMTKTEILMLHNQEKIESDIQQKISAIETEIETKLYGIVEYKI